MVTEAIGNAIFDALASIIEPILKGSNYPALTVLDSFMIPSIFFSYVQSLFSQLGLALPPLIAFWTWRQIKA